MENENRVLTCDFSSGGFLSENPEAYGLISDARPVASDGCLVAVGGYTPEDGMHPPTLTVNADSLLDLNVGFYHTLVAATPANESILRLNFGKAEGRQTHPLARYCAVATQMLTYDILMNRRQDVLGADTPEDRAAELTEAITKGIEKLRNVVREQTGPRPGSEKFFSVSLGACDVAQTGTDEYRVDFYSVGGFSLYLLDRDGMRPMQADGSDLLTGDGEGHVTVKRFKLRHQGAFALLLLSRNAGDPSLSEQRGIAGSPGLLWRHRMRLEDQFVRILLSGVDVTEAAERTERILAGRCHGWENVSGAFTICNATFDEFKSQCLPRLAELERLIALFPEGYDPDAIEKPASYDAVEREYVLNALKSRPRLLEKTRETLSKYVLEMLDASDHVAPAEPVGYDGEHYLSKEAVDRVYARFDGENASDRKKLADNRLLLRDLFSEHWLKLRPLLCDLSADSPEGAQAYACCLDLQKRVARLTSYRRQKLNRVRDKLLQSLECLELQGEDWVRAKGGDDSPEGWFRTMTDTLPQRAREAEEDWTRFALYLRSLQTAYTGERHTLFLRDTMEGKGIWHDEYARILEGELLPEVWRMYVRRIEADAPHYRELLRIAETLSRRNAELKTIIYGRAAERRTANAISEDEDWQISCLLGALREDAAWGPLVAGVVDQGFRNEYRAVVRRWQENNELIVRQKEAFADYCGMYESFLRD